LLLAVEDLPKLVAFLSESPVKNRQAVDQGGRATLLK
jgi:hypothetical protein